MPPLVRVVGATSPPKQFPCGHLAVDGGGKNHFLFPHAQASCMKGVATEIGIGGELSFQGGLIKLARKTGHNASMQSAHTPKGMAKIKGFFIHSFSQPSHRNG